MVRNMFRTNEAQNRCVRQAGMMERLKGSAPTRCTGPASVTPPTVQRYYLPQMKIVVWNKPSCALVYYFVRLCLECWEAEIRGEKIKNNRDYAIEICQSKET